MKDRNESEKEKKRDNKSNSMTKRVLAERCGKRKTQIRAEERMRKRRKEMMEAVGRKETQGDGKKTQEKEAAVRESYQPTLHYFQAVL